MTKVMQAPPKWSRIIGFVLLYLFYLAVACAIPLLHACIVNPALETTRDPILMPAPFLVLKWISQFGEALAIIIATSGFCLCLYPKRRIGISVGLAVILLSFTTLYGSYAAILLSSELTHSLFTARVLVPSK